ncbi:MAG: hypothetical protein EOO05_21845, partial [Chitinophagaceae bacterium]
MEIKAASHTAILRSVIVVFYLVPFMLSAQKNNPLRIGVAGLTHSNVHWIFNSAKTENIEIVG